MAAGQDIVGALKKRKNQYLSVPGLLEKGKQKVKSLFSESDKEEAKKKKKLAKPGK